MKCPECQTENPIDRLYCQACGAPLEHEVADVKKAVDREIRTEKARATSRAVRWLLAAGIILMFVGTTFRSAYKDLPGNDIVAFATAPTTPINDRVTVTTDQFGIPLPNPKPIQPPREGRADPESLAQLRQEAYRRAAVALKHRGSAQATQGLLLGDLVLSVPQPEGKDPLPVHVADIRTLRPAPHDEWEITAVNLPKATRVNIPDFRKVKIKLLEPQPEGEPQLHEIPLTTVQSIKPAFP